jgi:hypothetical protein
MPCCRVCASVPYWAPRRTTPTRAALAAQEHQMLDLIMLAVALGFFALSLGYTIACDRL